MSSSASAASVGGGPRGKEKRTDFAWKANAAESESCLRSMVLAAVVMFRFPADVDRLRANVEESKGAAAAAVAVVVFDCTTGGLDIVLESAGCFGANVVGWGRDGEPSDRGKSGNAVW